MTDPVNRQEATEFPPGAHPTDLPPGAHPTDLPPGAHPTGFLYPMLDAETASDTDELLTDLARSSAAKAAISAELTARSRDDLTVELDRAADAVVERLRAGGRIFTCGNGGSATDAEGAAALFAVPPDPNAAAIPARSLVADVSILTALSNDIGFEWVFSRQLMAHGRAEDVILGFSTSGNSANVIAAFEHAAGAGMLTVGLAGYAGGAMASCGALAHCLIVRADSVHRIQEAQSALLHTLWRRVQVRLDPAAAA